MADVLAVAQSELGAFGHERKRSGLAGLEQSLIERFGQDVEVAREQDGGTDAEPIGGHAEGVGGGDVCRETVDGGLVLGGDVCEGEAGIGELAEEGDGGLRGEGAGVYFEVLGVGEVVAHGGSLPEIRVYVRVLFDYSLNWLIMCLTRYFGGVCDGDLGDSKAMAGIHVTGGDVDSLCHSEVVQSFHRRHWFRFLAASFGMEKRNVVPRFTAHA